MELGTLIDLASKALGFVGFIYMYIHTFRFMYIYIYIHAHFAKKGLRSWGLGFSTGLEVVA